MAVERRFNACVMKALWTRSALLVNVTRGLVVAFIDGRFFCFHSLRRLGQNALERVRGAVIPEFGKSR